MQNEITKSTKLLDKHGELIQKGYAKSLLLDYDRKSVKASCLKLKEWDYFMVYNENYGVAITISSICSSGLISASFIDFKNQKEKTKSIIRLFPLWKVKLPETSAIGNIKYKDKAVSLEFKYEKGVRKLHMVMKNFEDGSDFKFSVTLTNEPQDSMVIATPFKENKKEFYYNQKIIGMRAEGKLHLKGKIYNFSSDNSFGLLDWGRGVWPHKVTWNWSAGQGMLEGKVFGFNLGYGFGDTSAATENMLFIDGIAHKLEDVTFHIPKNENNEYEYLKPWTFTSSDKRFEAEFVPILDRSDKFSLVLISSDQHQVFGKFTGKVVLDDGRILEIKDFLGFVERVENKW